MPAKEDAFDKWMKWFDEEFDAKRYVDRWRAAFFAGWEAREVAAQQVAEADPAKRRRTAWDMLREMVNEMRDWWRF